MHYDIDMPNVDLIELKKRDVQAALNYEYKEEDIDRIIEEKNRFRAHPTNYAMRKTQLMKVGSMAPSTSFPALTFTSALGTRCSNLAWTRDDGQRH